MRRIGRKKRELRENKDYKCAQDIERDGERKGEKAKRKANPASVQRRRVERESDGSRQRGRALQKKEGV